MANIFANALAALSKLANNGVSTFTFWTFFNETECPKEML